MATQNRRETKGRHPLLKRGNLAYRIFLELKQNPGLTIKQIAKVLLEDYQSINGQIQRLKGEGLIVAKPVQKGNRVVSGYFPVNENETGFARDRIEVETTVYVNSEGSYSVKSRVIGQDVYAESFNPLPVHTHTHYIVVPKPNEPLKTRELFSEDYVPGSRAKNPQGVVLEGEAVDITENEDQ